MSKCVPNGDENTVLHHHTQCTKWFTVAQNLQRSRIKLQGKCCLPHVIAWGILTSWWLLLHHVAPLWEHSLVTFYQSDACMPAVPLAGAPMRLAVIFLGVLAASVILTSLAAWGITYGSSYDHPGFLSYQCFFFLFWTKDWFPGIFPYLLWWPTLVFYFVWIRSFENKWANLQTFPERQGFGRWNNIIAYSRQGYFHSGRKPIVLQLAHHLFSCR